MQGSIKGLGALGVALCAAAAVGWSANHAVAAGWNSVSQADITRLDNRVRNLETRVAALEAQAHIAPKLRGGSSATANCLHKKCG
jgi:hypothetical protein